MRRRPLGLMGLAWLLAGGCTTEPIEPPAPAPAEIGTLSITVIGGQVPWSPWGSGWVERVGDGGGATAFTVPATGTVTLELAAGTYDVRFVPPVGYRAPAAGALTRVVVPTGGTATAAFEIRAVTGLSIVVSGLSAANPGSGGVVTIVRTDTTPNDTTVLYVREDGLVDGAVVEAQPGSYSVFYRPPVRFRLAAGARNPQTASLVEGQTTYFRFPVEPLNEGNDRRR